ncbi:MAG: PQQ-binding-like beta-propeller repeat protein [bacterium]|nr:PQQ-binding-like beta-propeller repeat protein [bacterium]
MTRTAICLAVLLALPIGAPTRADEKTPFTLAKLKGRQGKLLHKAAYGKDGRLGFLNDTNGDGLEEFVYIAKQGERIRFEILSLADDSPIVGLDLGQGFPAGLGAVNLDDDERSEYLAVFGSRRGELAKRTFKTIFSALVGVGVAMQTNWIVVRTPAAAGVDVFDLVALDDDGTILWRRDLRDEITEGESWGNTRFQSIVIGGRQRVPAILLSDDARHSLIGINGRTGETGWSRRLEGDRKPSKLTFGELIDEGRALPVLSGVGTMLILDPATGEAILDDEVDRGRVTLPSKQVFGEGDAKGFLVFGDDRSELRMVSLTTGKLLWSHKAEKVKDVLREQDGSLVVIWRHGIKRFAPDGTLLEEIAAPGKIKTTFSPVLRDIDGDDSVEMIFTSGKKIICWNPRSNEVLWTVGLGTFVGGANPVALYDRFVDIDEDGWLDVPAASGAGGGHWISGKSGELLIKAGVGVGNPLVGDWNGDGKRELFWFKSWWEIRKR